MNMKRNKILTHAFLLVLVLLSLGACHKVPVGFLKADNAEFVPKILSVYRTPHPSTPRASNNAPWVSTRIQGVAGTNPINYEYVSCKVANGADLDKFTQAVEKGYLKVDGGLVQFYQEGVAMVPNGDYTITLRVYNDGHSKTLEDILIIRVEDEQPDPKL